MDYKLTVCDSCKTILVNPDKEYWIGAYEGDCPVPKATFYYCPSCYARLLQRLSAESHDTKESMQKFLTAYKQHYGVGEHGWPNPPR